MRCPSTPCMNFPLARGKDSSRTRAVRKAFREQLDLRQHLQLPERLSVHAGVELQSIEQWRHQRSGASFLELGVQWKSHHRHSASVLQSQCVHSVAGGNVRQCRAQQPEWAGAEWDTSLWKTARISERLSFQLRGDAFNVLNHTNLNTPNLVV
jgi:hypothetical protein